MSLNNLNIYNDSVEITAELDAIVTSWPWEHRKSLGDQLRRASVSISNNIAEGYGRLSTGDRVRFFIIADASIFECQSIVTVAENNGLVEPILANTLRGRLIKLSFQLIAFAHRIVSSDPSYKSTQRKHIERRFQANQRSRKKPKTNDTDAGSDSE